MQCRGEGLYYGWKKSPRAQENQVESQRVLLRNAKDQLAASKTQITTLKKKLEEAEKENKHAKKA